jgi:hypothetical protein
LSSSFSSPQLRFFGVINFLSLLNASLTEAACRSHPSSILPTQAVSFNTPGVVFAVPRRNCPHISKNGRRLSYNTTIPSPRVFAGTKTQAIP